MDPNEALRKIREAFRAYDLDNDLDAAEVALEHFTALDEWLSKDGFLPTDWKAEEDKPEPPAEDVDPARRFQMYTPEGNAAVRDMVERVIADAQFLGTPRAAVIDAMRNGMREVAKTHPEVRDTEPRGAIYDALDAYFDTEGWVHVEDGSL